MLWSSLRARPVHPTVGVGGTGNAANPGWLGLQNIRSRHAEQTGEVVRNHEVGTCRTCGSELPRAFSGVTCGTGVSRIERCEVFWGKSGVDARRSCRRRGTSERIPGEAGQIEGRACSARKKFQRSQGALKERPSPRRQQSPVLTNWTRTLRSAKNPEGQLATAKGHEGRDKSKKSLRTPQLRVACGSKQP